MKNVVPMDSYFRGRRTSGPLVRVVERVAPTVGICRLSCGHAVVHRLGTPGCGVIRHRCRRCEQAS